MNTIQTNAGAVIVKQGSKLAKALLAYALHHTRETLAKEAKGKAQAIVRAYLPDTSERSLVLPDGSKLASDNEQAGRNTCDLEKLKADFPLAYAACVTQGEAFRVTRLTSAIALLKH